MEYERQLHFSNNIYYIPELGKATLETTDDSKKLKNAGL